MPTNNLYQIIAKRRSVRFFKQKKVSLSIIKNVINCARLAPSAANLQFIEYLVIDKKEIKDKVFECLRFAGYVVPKRNPAITQRPAFYIVLFINKERSKEPNLRDIGASAQNILLSLLAFKCGGCWLQNIDRSKLLEIIKPNQKYEIDSVIAAGFPAEEPILEEDSLNVKYWVDDTNRLHVPKRPLEEVFHYNNL